MSIKVSYIPSIYRAKFGLKLSMDKPVKTRHTYDWRPTNGTSAIQKLEAAIGAFK